MSNESREYLADNTDTTKNLLTSYSIILNGGGNGITTSRASVLWFDLSQRSYITGIDNLLFRGSTAVATKWGTGLKQGINLTYSFSSPNSTYNTSPGSQLSLAPTQINAARQVMQAYANISNLTFSEVADTPTSAGDIRWGRSSNRTEVPTAYAYYPHSNGVGGDIWIGPGYDTQYQPPLGSYSYHTFVHELGHAMGLVHPHEGTVSSSYAEDQLKYSVMSYRSYAGAGLGGYTTHYYPTTPMLNDIAAIQYLYGANTNYRSGNNVYNWTADTSIFETIYDSGGIDSIDASNQAQSVTLNLNSGTWSQIGKAFWNGQAYVRDCLTIAYSSTIENATGSAYNDTLIGNSSNNLLNGGAGADIMQGNAGDDTYYVDNGGDIIIESSGGGTDSAISSIDLALAANVENLTLTGSARNGTGNGLNNIIIGNTYANILNGGAGSDVLVGGRGDDIYIVDNAGDSVREYANEGTDSVNASVSYTLGDNVENLTLTGSTALDGNGNASNNILIGNAATNVLMGYAGDDILDGQGGSDYLYGGTGNDVYLVDSTGDRVYENANEGIDTVNSSVTHVLAANVENLTLIGTDQITGYGNELNNIIIGNKAHNYLYGGAGDDILDGGAGTISYGDSLWGGTGNDTYLINSTGDYIREYANEGIDTAISKASFTLSPEVENLILTGTAAINGAGNNLNNNITGNSAANILNGGTGADQLRGMAGNDTYYVDNSGDAVFENFNEGIDTVNSSITYRLGANIENLTLIGANQIYGYGNELNNTIIGNSAYNFLQGGAGNDTLDGGEGDSSRWDSLWGGTGDDTYLINNSGDFIKEYANEGIDTARSKVSFALHSEVENLILTGTAAINGTGNNLNNSITGNSAANTLTGGTGNDILAGGAGSDTYIFNRGDGADRIQEVRNTSTSEIDTLRFAANIRSDQLWFSKQSSYGALVVGIIGTSDKISIESWYANPTTNTSGCFIEKFQAGNGKTLTYDKVDRLVNAMAAFAPPAMGQTTLPSNYQQALAPVLAAAWS